MTCASCGSITCPHPDPVYAGITPSPVAADLPIAGSRHLAGDRHTPSVTGGFVRVTDQCVRNGETDGLRGEAQGVAVHGDGYAIDAVFPSSGKADDISGESRV